MTSQIRTWITGRSPSAWGRSDDPCAAGDRLDQALEVLSERLPAALASEPTLRAAYASGGRARQHPVLGRDRKPRPCALFRSSTAAAVHSRVAVGPDAAGQIRHEMTRQAHDRTPELFVELTRQCGRVILASVALCRRAA